MDYTLFFSVVQVKALGYDLTHRLLGYERVYLPLCKVADTPFHTQGDNMLEAVYIDDEFQRN